MAYPNLRFPQIYPGIIRGGPYRGPLPPRYQQIPHPIPMGMAPPVHYDQKPDGTYEGISPPRFPDNEGPYGPSATYEEIVKGFAQRPNMGSFNTGYQPASAWNSTPVASSSSSSARASGGNNQFEASEQAYADSVNEFKMKGYLAQLAALAAHSERVNESQKPMDVVFDRSGEVTPVQKAQLDRQADKDRTEKENAPKKEAMEYMEKREDRKLEERKIDRSFDYKDAQQTEKERAARANEAIKKTSQESLDASRAARLTLEQWKVKNPNHELIKVPGGNYHAYDPKSKTMVEVTGPGNKPISTGILTEADEMAVNQKNTIERENVRADNTLRRDQITRDNKPETIKALIDKAMVFKAKNPGLASFVEVDEDTGEIRIEDPVESSYGGFGGPRGPSRADWQMMRRVLLGITDDNDNSPTTKAPPKKDSLGLFR